MPKYRKKPVEVEAWQWNGEGRSKWPRYLIDTPTSQITDGGTITGLLIQTLEGDMAAMRGDWIIRGVKGEVYPCKPNIFEQTYEPVRAEPDVKSRFSDPRLEELLIQAQKRWDAMTPERRKEMREAQRKGYVVAEFRMGHPKMSKEDAEEIYEKVVQGIGL